MPKTLKIGSLTLKNRLISAPMAGISDAPFRELCCRFGASLAVSEMVDVNRSSWTTTSMLRRTSNRPNRIKAVQIVGSDPKEMAAIAKWNEDNGAHLIDINMGCPAKKINKKLAGSALLQYPILVEQILTCVVNAVQLPVTLKIRTGWDIAHRNFLEIARLAENCGIAALTLHGRTRACFFSGQAEYDSIKQVKESIRIPVIANGDITSPQKAKEVFDYTGADAIMIGRAAQGNPWIFEQIEHYLDHGSVPNQTSFQNRISLIQEHMDALYLLYGEYKGVRIARKHVSWYLINTPQSKQFRRLFNAAETAKAQFTALEAFFNTLH